MDNLTAFSDYILSTPGVEDFLRAKKISIDDLVKLVAVEVNKQITEGWLKVESNNVNVWNLVQEDIVKIVKGILSREVDGNIDWDKWVETKWFSTHIIKNLITNDPEFQNILKNELWADLSQNKMHIFNVSTANFSLNIDDITWFILSVFLWFSISGVDNKKHIYELFRKLYSNYIGVDWWNRSIRKGEEKKVKKILTNLKINLKTADVKFRKNKYESEAMRKIIDLFPNIKLDNYLEWYSNVVRRVVNIAELFWYDFSKLNWTEINDAQRYFVKYINGWKKSYNKAVNVMQVLLLINKYTWNVEFNREVTSHIPILKSGYWLSTRWIFHFFIEEREEHWNLSRSEYLGIVNFDFEHINNMLKNMNMESVLTSTNRIGDIIPWRLEYYSQINWRSVRVITEWKTIITIIPYEWNFNSWKKECKSKKEAQDWTHVAWFSLTNEQRVVELWKHLDQFSWDDKKKLLDEFMKIHEIGKKEFLETAKLLNYPLETITKLQADVIWAHLKTETWSDFIGRKAEAAHKVIKNVSNMVHTSRREIIRWMMKDWLLWWDWDDEWGEFEVDELNFEEGSELWPDLYDETTWGNDPTLGTVNANWMYTPHDVKEALDENIRKEKERNAQRELYELGKANYDPEEEFQRILKKRIVRNEQLEEKKKAKRKKQQWIKRRRRAREIKKKDKEILREERERQAKVNRELREEKRRKAAINRQARLLKRKEENRQRELREIAEQEKQIELKKIAEKEQKRQEGIQKRKAERIKKQFKEEKENKKPMFAKNILHFSNWDEWNSIKERVAYVILWKNIWNKEVWDNTASAMYYDMYWNYLGYNDLTTKWVFEVLWEENFFPVNRWQLARKTSVISFEWWKVILWEEEFDSWLRVSSKKISKLKKELAEILEISK